MACGVDVGGTKILAVAVDDHGHLTGEPLRCPTPRGGPAVLDAVVAVVAQVADSLGGLDAVGVGIPGLVDRGGRLAMGPNLPDAEGTAFKVELQRRLGRPVAVDNDATCAMWAEARLGAAQGAEDAVLVTLGTGIGGGFVGGGLLQRGANGFAGEFGHMVVDPRGPLCPCGQRGCWERFASGSGLGRLAREAAESRRGRRLVELAGGDPELVKGEHVTVAAAEGDPEAIEVFRELGWWTALGIANLISLLDPQVVVIGGGLVRAGTLLLDPVRRAYQDLVPAGPHRPPVPILPARLGELAGAIGAGLLALDR
jgi:glucokinase